MKKFLLAEDAVSDDFSRNLRKNSPRGLSRGCRRLVTATVKCRSQVVDSVGQWVGSVRPSHSTTRPPPGSTPHKNHEKKWQKL